MITKNQLTILSRFLEKELDPAFANRAKIILSNLDPKPGMKVLDIGCGRGFYEKIISHLFKGVKVIGLDQRQEYLPNWQHPQVTFQVADAQALPFPNQSFDRIICSEVLEHLNNNQKALQEIKRVLKKGGMILLTVPMKNYPFTWDPLNFILEHLFKKHIPARWWWLAGIWADHQRLYSENELFKKIESVNLEVKKIWRTTTLALPFAHFLLYGIGKNLVEKGLVGQEFNRFRFSSRPSLFLRLVKLPFAIFNNLNNSSNHPKRYVNLVIQVKKR